MFRFVGAVLVLVASAALALEFKPYPTAQITESQWTSYFDQVKAAHGASVQEFREHRLLVFHDPAGAVWYAFTQADHPAHPAWITRRLRKEGEQLFFDQIGYFVREEAPFAELFRQYQATNQRMIEEMKRQQQQRAR